MTAPQNSPILGNLDRNSHVSYRAYWEEDKSLSENTVKAREMRKQDYMQLTNQYYDISTDMYEQAWGTSFHFCTFGDKRKEGFRGAMARHEHYLAQMIGLRKGMTVLDVGCGVGGPACEIATFSDCNVIGLNNNQYQLDKADHYIKVGGLKKQVSLLRGDFLNIPLENNSVDAAYAIEATVHAPRLVDVYSEIYRVLRPGGVFGVYEWVMTGEYDDGDSHHRAIRLGIERGSGVASMPTASEAIEAMLAAGFQLEVVEDLATRKAKAPWYYPIAGELKHITSPGDIFNMLRLTWLGRTVFHELLRFMERIGLVSAGSSEAADNLILASDSIVTAGRLGLFTPMFLMVARKPLH